MKSIRDLTLAFVIAAAVVILIVMAKGRYTPAAPQDNTVAEATAQESAAPERRAAGGELTGTDEAPAAPAVQVQEEVETVPAEEAPADESAGRSEQTIQEALIIEGTALDLSTVKDKLPSYYISDDVSGKDYITPVRDQGYTKLCWVYATLGAIEADLLATHKKAGLKTDTLDLSEKHLAYYNLHRATGSVGGLIDDDYRELDASGVADGWIADYDTGYVISGGVPDYCASLLMAWKGPVQETGNDSFMSIYGRESIYTDNAEIPSDAYENTFCHVTSVREVAATPANRDLAKHLIMEHGAVTASINSADQYWTGGFSTLYDYEPYEGDNLVDHEILVVGWDDDYPTGNFVRQPQEPGAWICRNSWGESLGEKGYFRVSYEDTVINANNFVAYETALPGDDDWYDRNYQVDGFITQVNDLIVDQRNLVYYLEEDDTPYAVWYTAESDELLRAVAFFSTRLNSSYELRIYQVGDDSILSEASFQEESLGTPVLTQQVSSETGGYQSYVLEHGVALEAGQSFVVVVDPMQDEKLVFEKAMDMTAAPNIDEWSHELGGVHTSNTASLHSLLGTEDGMLLRQSGRDFCIKAYTTID